MGRLLSCFALPIAPLPGRPPGFSFFRPMPTRLPLPADTDTDTRTTAASGWRWLALGSALLALLASGAALMH